MTDKTILICDDSIAEIRVLVSILRSANYRLIISNNGKDACSRAAALAPDLILLDVRMPFMDGFAACRLLKAHADTKAIPIIFLTAANELEDRLEGLRIGAVDYIVKPADAEEVLLRIGVQIRSGSLGVCHQKTSGQAVESTETAIITAACRILENDLSNAPALEELASMVGTHRHKLSAAFKSVFGSTVYGWLRERRLRKACEWLELSTMSMQSIAEELGFSTSGNFSTAFKDRFGVNPSDYRKTTQKLTQVKTYSDVDLTDTKDILRWGPV